MNQDEDKGMTGSIAVPMPVLVFGIVIIIVLLLGAASPPLGFALLVLVLLAVVLIDFNGWQQSVSRDQHAASPFRLMEPLDRPGIGSRRPAAEPMDEPHP